MVHFTSPILCLREAEFWICGYPHLQMFVIARILDGQISDLLQYNVVCFYVLLFV